MADVKVPIEFGILQRGQSGAGGTPLAEPNPDREARVLGPAPRRETVSRMHGVIEAAGGDIHVTDLGSTRGTTVNGERIAKKKARLQSGDEVMFGDCTSV